MWYLRACPRCRGDLFVDQKPGEEQAMVCLQCGHDFTPRVAIREWIEGMAFTERSRPTRVRVTPRRHPQTVVHGAEG